MDISGGSLIVKFFLISLCSWALQFQVVVLFQNVVELLRGRTLLKEMSHLGWIMKLCNLGSLMYCFMTIDRMGKATWDSCCCVISAMLIMYLTGSQNKAFLFCIASSQVFGHKDKESLGSQLQIVPISYLSIYGLRFLSQLWGKKKPDKK